MAPTPYKVCGGNSASGSTTLIVTVTQTTTAGDAIGVWVTSNANNLTGVTDSKGNTYTQAGTTAVNGTLAGAWFVALNTAKLTASTDTITLTCSGTGGAKALTAAGCSGLLAAGAVDQTPTPTTGSSTAPSITSGTLGQANELCLTGETHGASGSAITWGNSFTSLDSQHAPSAEFANDAYLVVSSTSAVTSSATITAAAWGMALVTLKFSVPSVTTGALPGGIAGTPYSQTETETGGTAPFTWSVTGGTLPTGLSLSSAGVISGTPSAAGTFSFTVQVSDSFSFTATASQTITISAAAAFPSAILDLQADLNLGGTWTGISGDVFSERQKPVIQRGRPDETSSAVASSAQFLLDNRAFKYSPHNPTGAYYGNLTRNTPVRFSVPDTANYLRLEQDTSSYASTGSVNVTNALEARIDLKMSNWTSTVLAMKWSATAGNYSWAWLLNADGTLGFWYTTDGSTINKAVSTQPLPWPGGRISLKVTYNNTSAAVAFYYATTIGGSYTQIGATVTGGTTGGVFAGTAAVWVGQSSAGYFAALTGFQASLPVAAGSWAPVAYGSIQGKVYEFQLRQGIGGSLLANPVFSSQTAGVTSFADAQSNTWALNGTAEISSRRYRFHGEIAEWPQAWDSSQSDVYVNVQGNGLLRRLSQQTIPLQSALRRAWSRLTGIYAPVAYWPCEDGNGPMGDSTAQILAQPTQIASGLAAGKPMTLGGTTTTQTTFASDGSFTCSDSIPVVGTQTWTGPIVPYSNPASSPANVFRFLLHIPSGGDTNNARILHFRTRGSITFVALDYDTSNGGEIQMEGYDQNLNQIFALSKVQNLNGLLCLVELSLQTSGANVIAQCTVLKQGATTAAVVSGTQTSQSVGIATQCVVNPNGVNVQSAVGQIAVQSSYAAVDSVSSASSLIGPFNAWAGETAGLRFARLCNEQGFACRVIGPPSQSVVMGPQGISTFLSLLQECEAADHGMIVEPRQSLALGYRTSASLTNQNLAVSGTLPVSLSYTAATLGGGGGMTMQPTDDDLLTINDEVVTRGSTNLTGSSFETVMTSAQYAANAGLSTQAPPNGVGSYQDSRTVNVWSDTQLGDQSGWVVHLGTVNELRYPAIPVDMARSQVQSQSYAVSELDLGDYLAVTSPPQFLAADTIKAVVWGIIETLGGFIWTIEWQTTPESPYEVLVAGSGASADCRADTAGSVLGANATSGATSLTVNTTAGNVPWTTAAGDFPFDIIVGGERMTVTNITSATSPQTFTVTRSVNGIVKAHASSEQVFLFQPCYYALA